jgi:hypothetical protein
VIKIRRMSKRNSLKLLIAMFVGYRIAEKNFKEVLDRVSTYKSEVSSLMTIGRQNAINCLGHSDY